MGTLPIAKVVVPVPIPKFGCVLDYKIPEELTEQVKIGCFVEIPLGRRKIWGIVESLNALPANPTFEIKNITGLRLNECIFDTEHLKFLSALADYYFYPKGEVFESAIPGPIRESNADSLTRMKKKLLDHLAQFVPVQPSESKTLNAHQTAAIQRILTAGPGGHLLYGVTGSGKTEVYLNLMSEVLKLQKSILFLVPEIALTPLLTSRIEARFPGQVSTFHSGQSTAQQKLNWLAVVGGHKKIVVGARSAIFAPLKNLGIILVDEEHDSSYKQEDRLRYHARDASLQLGSLYQIPVVLGSATPSAETLFQVQQKHYTYSELPERAVSQATYPSLEIVDLKKYLAVENKDPQALSDKASDIEVPQQRGDFFLSPPLRNAIEETLSKKHQSILFLNRRGLASQILCRSCGTTLQCPNCAVNLTPHKQALHCHYCAYTSQIPLKCSECKKDEEPFITVGVGTESIEEAVQFHFPHAKILRMDRDTIQNSSQLETLIDEFSKGAADILIGTQMVAKGHDFPMVTLVGILLADLGMSVPDFRASEMSLQLLLQVAGRSGRQEHPGRVILQSFNPSHPVIQCVKNYSGLADYKTFMELECEKRKELWYPPGGHLVLLRFDGTDELYVRKAARYVGEALRKLPLSRIQVLGPTAAPLSKIRGRYRYHILLKCLDSTFLSSAVQWILSGWGEKNLERKFRTRLVADRDPQNSL